MKSRAKALLDLAASLYPAGALYDPLKDGPPQVEDIAEEIDRPPETADLKKDDDIPF